MTGSDDADSLPLVAPQEASETPSFRLLVLLSLRQCTARVSIFTNATRHSERDELIGLIESIGRGGSAQLPAPVPRALLSLRVVDFCVLGAASRHRGRRLLAEEDAVLLVAHSRELAVRRRGWV
jgi:hypothetical protein